MVKEPGIFSLVAPGENVKFPRSPLRLAAKAGSPGTLWRKLHRPHHRIPGAAPAGRYGGGGWECPL